MSSIALPKGKIEVPFQYIEKNLLNGRTFDDLSDLRQTAAWWLANRSDVHVHDTTGQKAFGTVFGAGASRLEIAARPSL